MSTTETLPSIDDCIDLYAQIHDRYGDGTFDPDDLRRQSGTREETGVEDSQSLTRLLDLLVAYGLLDRHSDGRYRVRCDPDETPDRWRAKASTRVESLYQRVQRTTTPSRDRPTDDTGPDTLSHEGDAFVSVYVTSTADLDSTRADVRTAADERPEFAGIVLRSPGELAGEIQRFADSLCGSEAPTGGERTFEKVTTDLIGDDKNDLEFRLFLRETA